MYIREGTNQNLSMTTFSAQGVLGRMFLHPTCVHARVHACVSKQMRVHHRDIRRVAGLFSCGSAGHLASPVASVWW